MTPSLSQLRGRRPLASLGQDARDVLLARARPLRACLEDRRPAERGTRGVRASHARPGAGPQRRVPAHSRRASLASHMALEGPARRTLPPSPPRAQTRKTLLRAVSLPGLRERALAASGKAQESQAPGERAVRTSRQRLHCATGFAFREAQNRVGYHGIILSKFREKCLQKACLVCRYARGRRILFSSCVRSTREPRRRNASGACGRRQEGGRREHLTRAGVAAGN